MASTSLLLAIFMMNSIHSVLCSNKTTFDKPCKVTTIDGRNHFFIFLLTTIFVAAVIGNSFAIIVIILSPTLRRQKTNTYVVSLAFSDLAVVLFTVPIRIDQYLHNRNFCFDITVCQLQNITDVITNVASVTHLFVIAVDRFLSIARPFFYHTLSKNITLISVIVVWAYTVVWASLGVFNWQDPKNSTFSINEYGNVFVCMNDNSVYFFCLYSITTILPLIIMAVLYTIIMKIALKQVRTIATLVPADLKDATKVMGERRRREIKITKTLAIVYGAFVVSWLPVTIITISSILCPKCYKGFRENYEKAFYIILTIFVETLPPVNSCINPFIYVIFNEQFRKATKVLIFKILKQPHFEEHTLRTFSKRNQTN